MGTYSSRTGNCKSVGQVLGHVVSFKHQGEQARPGEQATPQELARPEPPELFLMPLRNMEQLSAAEAQLKNFTNRTLPKMKSTENFEKATEHAVCESIAFDGVPQGLQDVFTDLRPRAEPETLLAEQPADMQREQASPVSEQQHASGSGTDAGLLSVGFAFGGAVDPEGVRKERCPVGVSGVRKHHAKTSGPVNEMSRQLDPNQLVRTADVGKTRTADLPHIYLVKYNCNRCDYYQGPFVLSQSEDLKPGSCPECHSLGTFTVKKKQVRRGIIC
ncbi:putative DNA replication licensing factor MCM2 [Ixodes scapularis]